jgi:hypothetical protein
MTSVLATFGLSVDDVMLNGDAPHYWDFVRA